jgi:mannose-1-phosphate guanylyltransferase
MAHIVRLLESQGFDELIANLHWLPDAIRGYFGDRLEYRYEPELLGAAGGVRNVRDFFGEEPVVVISGDALTDLDVRALVERHRSAGGVATLTVKSVPDTSEYGVVIHDEDGRVQGFQEKPDAAEALSELANCGIYCFSPAIFDFFPAEDPVDWADDVFPALLDHDVPFHVHEIDSYWNDVGSLAELRQGTWDALEGRVRLEVAGQEPRDGLHVGAGTELPGDLELVEPPAWIGERCELGRDLRLIGPVAVGDGCRIGAGASLRETILLPGASIPPGEVMIGAIVGPPDVVERLRPLDRVA